MHDPAVIIVATGGRRTEPAVRCAKELSPHHLIVIREEPQDASRDLFGFQGPVLFLPAADTLPAGPLLRTLLELHEVERNSVTFMTTSGERAYGGGTPVARDAHGRIRAMDAPASLVAGGEACLELTTGIAVWTMEALFGKRGVTRATGLARFALDAAAGVLYERGDRVGAFHVPADGHGHPRELPADRQRGPESGLLRSGEHVCLAVDRPGFNSGQLIVFPKRAVTCWPSLTKAECQELAEFIQLGESALRSVYQFDALNLGWNSGVGEHLAVRLIPRWVGDLSFLPLISGLKPVPESPEQAWERLDEVIA